MRTTARYRSHVGESVQPLARASDALGSRSGGGNDKQQIGAFKQAQASGGCYLPNGATSFTKVKNPHSDTSCWAAA
jgi:hypothetical protein